VVVGMIDNLVRPLFMQGGADMSTLLIFFAILGGLNYFGLIGLLYGCTAAAEVRGGSVFGISKT